MSIRRLLGAVSVVCTGLALATVGCGERAAPAVPTSKAAPVDMPRPAGESGATASTSGEPKAQQPAEARQTIVHVMAVGRDGSPLAGMMPIATTVANAFEEPVAKGAPTKDDGKGVVAVPSDKAIYVRCWDPALRMFANNYHEIPAGPASETEELPVTMLPCASLDATLLGSDGRPLAGVSAGIMMIHPSEGPWWPSEGSTDVNGLVRFGSLPPGQFTIRFRAAGGGEAEAKDVLLMPGERVVLGALHLQ